MKTINPADRVKLEASKLLKQVRQELANRQDGAPHSEALRSLIARFRRLRGWQELDDSGIGNRLAALNQARCLELLALEAGHASWSQYAALLQGPPGDDEATELYLLNKSEFNLNVWCPSYEAARTYLDTHRGFYLLQYKGSFFLAQEGHIRGLGLDPGDPDWEKIGWDWVQPKDLEARDRLRQKLRSRSGGGGKETTAPDTGR